MSDDSLLESGDPLVANSDPTWFLDEGMPLNGPRPEWLPQKFKTVKQAITSLNELESKLGTAPVGDYDFGEHGQFFDKEHQAFKDLTAYAKEKRVSQEVFSKMLESVAKYGESLGPDYNTEKAKLGADADKRISLIDNWAKANLSPESYKALGNSLGTADSLIALEEIRGKMIGNTTPPLQAGSDINGSTGETLEDLEAELKVNFPKYKEDEKYRRDWKARNEAAVRRANGAGYVDKSGG